MKLHVTQLPCDEATFLVKLEAYRAEMEAHKLTVGVPAPFPEYEIMRSIVNSDGSLEIQRDELQEQAKAVGRDALAELDALKVQVAEKQSEIDALKAKVGELEAKAL